MILSGDSLAERQHDLNIKVNDAAAKNIPLDELDLEEKSDIDKLFKIDLASKYKNIDYLIEVLKSGDDLYISRVMKCLWLYDDEYKSWINPSHLQENVFPFMSAKMMKKFLVKIGTYVSDEDRAQDFYKYCVHNNFERFAFNFLINTSVAFKTDIITNHYSILDTVVGKKKDDIVFLIGNNFSLAEACQKKLNSWHVFRHLYSVDAELYLSKWEAFYESGVRPDGRLGLRTSKDIIVKHKNRIFNKIHFYFEILNLRIFLKYTTLEDAKQYAAALLPITSTEFWSCSYRTLYKPILDIIPNKEKLKFFKNIFESKYSDSEFEMTRGFYEHAYYDLMTADEKEVWALRYIQSPKKSFLSENKDREYLWYRFVTYDKAIPVIKKFVLNTPDPDKRAKIVNILIECTRNQDDLQKLFTYYNERHINEDKNIKEAFIINVIKRERIWEFNEKCWESFFKLLLSIDLFNKKGHHPTEDIDSDGTAVNNTDFFCTDEILVPVLFYFVINEQKFPYSLTIFMKRLYSIEDSNMVDECIKKITKQEHRDIIFQYLKQMWIDKIEKSLLGKEGGATLHNFYLIKYCNFITKLLNLFEKTDKEIPEGINYIIFITKNIYKLQKRKDTQFSKPNRTTLNEMIRQLKQDATKVPLFWDQLSFKRRFKVCLLKKLKVYFSNDLTNDFLRYFFKSLSNDIKPDNNNIDHYLDPNLKPAICSLKVLKLRAAIQGIFLLADECSKTEFVTKYAPTENKIDHDIIDKKYLSIQEAICSLVFYSRPRVPLEYILLFIKGDYIHYCLPLLYNYSSNLPKPQIKTFVNILLNSPVSMQKHGLKLAFQCFNLDDLKNLLLKTWKLSKNITLRMIIYTHLVKNIVHNRGHKDQREIFHILLTLSSSLNEKDHRNTLEILTNDNDFPDELTSAYLETAWNIVKNFPDSDNDYSVHSRRKISVLNNITNNIRLMEYNAVRNIVDYFTKDIKQYISKNNNAVAEAKYDLTVIFLANFDDEKLIGQNMSIIRSIMNTCLEMWNDSKSNGYFSRNFCKKFLLDLEIKHFYLKKEKNEPINRLFKFIAQTLLDTLPEHEVFYITLRFQFLYVTNFILDTLSTTENNLENLRSFTSTYAAEVAKIIGGLIDKQQYNITLLEYITKLVMIFAEILNDSLVVEKSHLVERLVTQSNSKCRRKWVTCNPRDTHQFKEKFRSFRSQYLSIRQRVLPRSIPVATMDNVLTYLSKELLSHNNTELILLALEILPDRISPESAEEYKYVVNNVHNNNTQVVKALIQQKAIDSKFRNISFLKY